MNSAQVEEAVLAVARREDGQKQLSCARAHVLAEDLVVTLREIGDYCQTNDIKITDCQLGCFGGGRRCD